MSFPIQTLVINPAGEEKHTVGPLDAQVRLVNTDGTAFSAGSGAYELPEAGKDTLGGIKQFDDTITGLAASGVIKLPDKK